MAAYQLDNAWRQARERLAGIEAGLDPSTIRHLETIGVGPGWRCLEVGGGGGSIAAWLCRRVGPSGQVVATDLDTRFLAALDYSQLAVRQHDIGTDDLPLDTFDLVHVRAVLIHLAERAPTALQRMVQALKPGGWLLAEEADFSSWAPAPGTAAAAVALFRKHWRVLERLWQARGMDPGYGRRLYADVAAQGLVEVQNEGRTTIERGGSAAARTFRLTWEQLRAPTLAAGELTVAEFEAFLALWNDPAFSFSIPMTWSVWGRRPR
jgi:ubiquinone/menaquinone biosynthesis C-methylase UbiE